jgi:hypothetical protein
MASAARRNVWVVDPGRRSITIHDPAGSARVLEGTARLDGGDDLAGLSIPMVRLFAI